MGFVLVVPASTGASQFPSLQDFYVPLARQLGIYVRTVVADTVPTGEPGRWVMLDSFKDDEDTRARYAGGYLYVKSGAQAGTQRRIRTKGYEGSYGAMGLTRVLDTALLPGVFVEVTKPLPVRQIGAEEGLVQFVNQGLGRIWTEVRIQITGNGTRVYSGLPDWLVNEAQIDGIYDWTVGIASTEPPIRSSCAPTLTVNGATVTLETGYSYSTAATFQLKAFVPANKLTYDGSAWGYSATDGLVNDTDMAAVPVKWVTPVAMVKALQHLIALNGQDETVSDAERDRREIAYRRRLQPWARAAADIIQNRLPRPTAPPSQGLTTIASPVFGAPLVGGSGWPNGAS